MSIPAPDEISIEDPLCNSSLGSMVTLDYVTPSHILDASESTRLRGQGDGVPKACAQQAAADS